MQQIVDIAEVLLLVVLAILQLGRWSQKTEDGPSDAIRIAKEGLAKAESTASDLRRHKHAWQEYLNTRFTVYDQTYARKREVELELRAIKEKQEADCDRIEEVATRVNKFSGV